MTINHLSRLERGEVGASVEALYRLGVVLGIKDLETLLRPYVKQP